MSELASEAGLPVATIKFYLREELLHPGCLTSKNQAQYDQGHVRRLMIIRFLLDCAHWTVAQVKKLFKLLYAPEVPVGDALEVAHSDLPPQLKHATDTGDILRMLQRWEWRAAAEDCGSVGSLTESLSTLHSLGIHFQQEELDRFARAMRKVAEDMIDHQTADYPASGGHTDFILRLMGVEVILADLWRLAQHDVKEQIIRTYAIGAD